MAPANAPTCPTLGAFLDPFITHLDVERGLSPNTSAAYRADCERFIAGLPGPRAADPSSITEKEVFEYVVAERKRGRCVTSVRRSLSALRTFFRFLIGERVIQTNPARGLEHARTWVRLPSYLQVDEVRRLLEAVRKNPSRFPLRDAALLELVYAAGLRVGEITTLTVESIRADLGILRCMGKGSRERIVPVSKRSLDAVKEYVEKERPRLVRGRPTEILFVSRGGRQLGREVVNAFLRKYALHAGLTGRITPHTLRHSFATHMIQRGADLRVVQEILGHVKVETTEIYTHLSKNDLKAAHRKHHPRG